VAGPSGTVDWSWPGAHGSDHKIGNAEIATACVHRASPLKRVHPELSANERVAKLLTRTGEADGRRSHVRGVHFLATADYRPVAWIRADVGALVRLYGCLMSERVVRAGAHRLWWRAPLCLITACVLVSCGNSHPASTATAAGPTFPNTPAGVQARWVLQAVDRQPISNAEVRAHFGQAVLAHATPAQLAEILNEKLVGYARVRLVSITSSRPNTLAFVMSVRGAQRFEVRVGVDTHGLIADLETLREIPPTTSAASVIPALATGWVARPVTFQAGGVTIYGTYTHPRTAAARTIPAAVLLAGSGTATGRNGNNLRQPDRDTLEAVANWLSADGVASLRYDKLGSGQTGWGRYAAHPERAGIKVYEQEAVAAFSFVARQPQVNPSRLAVVGHSEAASTRYCSRPG